MTCFFRKIVNTSIAILALSSISALAHSPQLKCEKKDKNIECSGGFSDGSSASGTEITAYSYEDKVLFAGKLDKDSKIIFAAPAGDFYVKFEGGAGHELEIDHADIK